MVERNLQRFIVREKYPKGSSEAVHQSILMYLITMTKTERTKRQTMINKTLYRKPKIGQHEPNLDAVLNSRALEGLASPAKLTSFTI